MAIKTTPYDSAKYLDSDEAIAAYIDEALESADPTHIAHALGVVARARGMTEIARAAGVSREHLYRALKETGNPELSTVVRVLKALGLRLSALPIVEEKPKRRAKTAA
ncbi:MAG TPA: addiction module antidote protein [Dongiaceae bacterium]|nr:addiction module antidote protein [Dongiaceae bacterium]